MISRLSDNVVIEREQFFMGTTVQIKVLVDASSDDRRAQAAIGEAFREIERIEKIFSVYSPTSEVYKINRLKKGQSSRVSQEVFDIIKKSIAFTEKTQGAFDITVGPLISLWRRAGKAGKLPSPSELAQARSLVGAHQLILDDAPRSISFAREGMSIDLGAVAKGYAADRAVEILKKAGIANAVVNCGGDIYCLGRRSCEKRWRIGVQHPRKAGKILMEIEVADMAIVTSGDYEKYFILGGKRYSHIIDPRTGYPVGDNIVSATVIADDTATADIFTTALCVLGEQGLKIVNSLKGADALIIIKDAGGLRVRTTDDFRAEYGVIEKEKIGW